MKIAGKKIWLPLLLALTTGIVYAQTKGNATKNNHASIQKMKWFEEAKMGMFIHWGLYAQSGGIWKDKRYFGITEWLMNRAQIPVAEYEQLAKQFNPVKFNAEEWVDIAKSAGCKYIVITSKHHDGFAMFHSAVSKYNIVDATPYAKDPIKELSIACKKAGIKLGFYYSQFQDWHEPNGGGNDWSFDEKKKDYKAYFRTKAVPQIKELLTNYGDVGLIWFDTPGDMTKEESQHFLNEIATLQPNCLVSSRVGNGLGDYTDFGDGEIPAGIVPGAWEAIFTHNDSWGYSQFDKNFKSPNEIIRMLATVASKGGNLMINIGPQPDGKLPYYSEKYFRETGKWSSKNKEALYGTTHSPIKPQPWGVMTQRITGAASGKIYAHVFDVPGNRQLLVPDFTAKVTSVYVLAGKKPLRFKQNGNDVTISLDKTVAAGSIPVITIQYSGTIKEDYANAPEIISPEYKEVNLRPDFANTTGNAKKSSLTFSHYFGDWKHAADIENMQAPEDMVSWKVRFTQPGDYKILLEYSADKTNEGETGILKIDNESFPFQALYTGERDEWKPVLFVQHPVAIKHIDKPGIYTIMVQPEKKGKELFKLVNVIVEPVK